MQGFPRSAKRINFCTYAYGHYHAWYMGLVVYRGKTRKSDQVTGHSAALSVAKMIDDRSSSFRPVKK